MFSRCVRPLLILLVIAALSLPVSPAHGQEQAEPLPAKPSRDLPIPAAVETAPAAAAPSDLPHPLPQAITANAANSETAAAAPNGDVSRWSRLAYQSRAAGNWDIYTANGDGSDPLNLSQHSAADARPQLNLDGTRVVFNSERDGNAEIYTVNADGSALTRLTYTHAADYSPAWSPDSQRIIFVSDRTGNNELFLMNADGSGLGQWTLDGASDSSPAWSPDGKWIAWKRTTNGLSSLLMMHPDGSEFTPLANGLRYVGDLSWSPASNKLLFDADVDGDYWNEIAEMYYPAWGHWEINVLVDANAALVDLWAGAYAPDGDSIAYSLVQYAVKNHSLVLQRIDLLRSRFSSGETSLIPGFGSDMNPSWRNIDWAAPTSRVSPLSPFVHAGNLAIQLDGSDNGPSGIRTFDVQSAPAADGPWIDLATNLKIATLTLPPIEPGVAVWLRARAKDYAGNVEAWPAAADAATQVYAWDVTARGVDSRGVSIPQAAVTGSPGALASMAAQGSGYRLLYDTEKSYTLGITAPGFGAASPSTLALNSDARLDLFLPPSGELLQNGGFEDGLNGWTGDGAAVTGDLATSAHSGSQGVLLGPDCVLWCMQGPYPLAPPTTDRGVTAVDEQGNFHVLQPGETGSPRQLHYQMYSLADGQWNEPEIIESVPLFPGGYIAELDIAVDGSGVVHVGIVTAHRDSGGNLLLAFLYAWRTPDGTWTHFHYLTQDIENEGEAVQMIGDPHGGVHILLDHRFYKKGPIDTWQSPLDIFELPPEQAIGNGAMALGPDGSVHFLADLFGALTYRVLSAQQTLSNPVVVWRDANGIGWLQSAIAADGTIHLLTGARYRYLRPSGGWSQAQPVAQYGIDTPTELVMQLDDAGRLYVFGQADYYARPVMEVRSPDVGWSPARYAGIPGYIFVNTFRVAGSGVAQVIAHNVGTMDYVYWRSPLGSTGVVSSVAQVVTLPAQTVHPTLSFFHKSISGDPHGQARLAVTVDNGGGPTVVYTSTAAAWTQGFADLEPWLGKTITVTLAVEQADGEPLLAVYLDDVSLGEWTTPVVAGIEPAHVYNGWDGVLITVRGDNFAAGANLRLGETLLAAALVDEHTLQAVLPSGLAPGHYDLWVQNPDGRQGASAAGLTLGGWQYLPVIHR